MSVSSLPEWKQLLLERKRREEEERERREKQEEEKLASMPAWKRGIIQRRKAKQDSLGDREKERDVCLLQVDVRPPSECLSDTDSFVTVNLGSDLSMSPDPGQWLDADLRPASQVSLETIVPVHENPFIRTQSSWRRGKDSEITSDPEIKEREREKSSPRGYDGEGRGRDIELKIERFRDLSEGREKESRRERRERENSREGWERDKSLWKESAKDAGREREFLKGRKDEDEKETDPTQRPFSPIVPCLRTIRADNIIIIEQERKGSDERRGRWRETERERLEEEGKRAMKMDLSQILAGGGSVTEIRASEVLIIKPSPNPEERSPIGGGGGGGKSSGREDGEMKASTDVRRESMGRELRADLSWLREKEKERPWGHATVIKEDRKDSLEDNVFVDRGGRVSQLLSKFGEHPKPPSRSKSSDNFLRLEQRKLSGDPDDQQAEADGKSMVLKGVPKRSFSFSDRVVGGRENGLEDNGYYERTTRDRIHSEKTTVPWVDVAGPGRETTCKIKMGCARLLDKDRFGKHRERQLKNEDETTGFQQHRSQIKNTEPMDMRVDHAEGDEGFTVVSVKNTEGISFARRVPIRQDGKTRAEREAKRLTGERDVERQLHVEKDSEAGGQIEVSDLWIEDGFESTIPPESMQQSFDLASLCHMGESQHSHESAFQECSSLLCPVTDRTLRGPEWSGTGPQGPYLTHSVLSQHTVDLISKIEKIGDTTVYTTERGERAYKAVYEETKDSDLETQMYGNTRAENLSYDIPRSPKRIPPMGIPPCPLEIQIPRTVFYVAEEAVEKKKAVDQSNEAQDWEEGKGIERRDSWRIGKPLSRIESLREKIRQRELERLKQREVEGGGGGEGTEINVTQMSDDERANEKEAELEAAVQTRKRSTEAEGEQEDAKAQTSVAAFDVTQEVGVLKTCPQLPVAVPHSQAVREEVASAASEVISDSFQLSEDEDDPVKHVEEQLRRHRAQHENREDTEEEEEEEVKQQEEEVKELSEEELEGFTSPLDPETPHPNSLTAMSRIYKLETVSSRSGLCMRDKTVDLPSVHLVKVKPLVSNAQQADSKALPGGDNGAVQTIQRQIEQFQLKEQEMLRSCASPNRGQQSPKSLLKHQVKDNGKTQERDHETSDSEVTPQRVCSPTSQLKPSNQTITITPAVNRSQSPDNALKSSDCAPTPASSPCSPSPAPSPITSPSPTPSPQLFSIRSASGGKGKRGATITITPRKTVVGGGGGTVSTAVSTVGSTTAKISPQQPQTTPTSAEPAKKKYPTVEEIEVIGGYQSLEKSCLMKNRGTPKRGNVCFDEEQLEQVCEYPSEASMLAYTLYPHDVWRLQGEEAQEEEAEMEGGTIVSKSTKSIGNAARRSLKVDESCPR